MNYFKWFPLVLISSISFFYLIASTQPGKIEYFFAEHILLVLMSYSISFLFFLAVAVTFLAFKFKSRTSAKVPTLLRRPNKWAIVILLMTIFLMYFHIPAKLAFAFSFPGFQEAIVIPTNQKSKTIGLYKVESIQRNPSGEVFFPTCNFWSGAVTSWYGFVYKPDLKQHSNSSARCGARFGAHTYTHLFEDWYIFNGTTC